MPARPLLVAVGVALALVGCTTGSRPSFGEDATATGPVGDAAVDAVLAELERTDGPPLTARYHLTRKLDPVESDATVVRSPGIDAVTLGTVRVLRGAMPRTCDLAAGSCQDGIDDQAFGAFGVSSDFWAASPARALRVTYGRRSGPPTPSTQAVAGQPAQCVDVPVGAGIERYCVSALGAIALWDTADKRVELTELRDTADPAFLSAPGA